MRALKNLLGTVLICLPSAIISYFIKGHEAATQWVTLISLSLLLFVVLVGVVTNVVVTTVNIRRIKNFVRHRQRVWDYTAECDRDVDAQIARIRRLLAFESAWFYLCAATESLVLAAAIISAKAYFIIPAVILALLTVTFRSAGAGNAEPGVLLNTENNPRIVGMVEELARIYAPGCDVQIYAIHGPYINATVYNGRYALCIGVTTMGLLSEAQLRAAVIHELLHIKLGDTELMYTISCAQRRVGFGSDDKSKSARRHLLTFMMGVSVQLAFRSLEFGIAATRAIEQRIDKAFANLCDDEKRRDLIGAIATLRCFHTFIEEGPAEMHIASYPDPMTDFESRSERLFRIALKRRESFWRELLEKELQTNNSQYFPFSSRRELLGVSKDGYEICPTEEDFSYLKETDALKDFSDESIFQGISLTFQIQRQEYLDALERLENGERRIADGENPELTELLELGAAAELCGLHDKAKSIYDGILEQYPNNANALYSRGCYYLNEYDERGIDMIWRAIDENSNYIKSGTALLNAFCVNMGLKERLCEVRERSAELLGNREKTYERLFDRNSRGRIDLPDLPEALTDEIIRFVKNECGDSLCEFYLFKKTIDDVSCIVIAISPTPETKLADWQLAYHNIFMFLDVKDEQYVLDTFTGEPPYIKRVKRVKGTLIYKKSQSEHTSK